MRNRVGLRELIFFAACLLAAGTGALILDLGGSVSTDQRVELVELIGLGLLALFGFGLFAWRRFAEQEREIEKRIAAEDQARFLAHHDHLTGLPNRRQLQEALSAAVTIPASAERAHAIFLLDLNGFKKVNDVFGHPRGDEVLSVVASRLSTVLREGDLLARTGGDEFAMVMRDVSGPEGAANIAKQILRLLVTPIEIGLDQHQIGSGIGIAMIPRDGLDAGELMRKADTALYKAKRSGQRAFAFYQDDMDEEARARDAIQRDLSAAIGTAALVPHYQPIVDLKTGQVRAFEALARWTHPELGLIPPDRFIPIAEDCGLIRPLSEHLLRCACSEAARWPNDVGLSFNVSPALLRDETFGLMVLQTLAATGLNPARLELEITENAIVRDLEGARQMLGAFRRAGIKIALDDFGTGATSLFHLRSLEFDVIKIDRSFVDLMTKENESAQIVKAILGLGHGLDVAVVAEGVENSSQSAALQEQGCTDGQGFLFSRAMPAEEALRFLSDHKNEAAA